MNKEFLSIEDVANYLNVDYQLIYKMVRSGQIPSLKLGRVYRIPKDKLEEYINNNIAGEPAQSELSFCDSCDKTFRNKKSIPYRCEHNGCNNSICVDCWERLNIRKCKKHQDN